jgi:hypothetical protein
MADPKRCDTCEHGHHMSFTKATFGWPCSKCLDAKDLPYWKAKEAEKHGA